MSQLAAQHPIAVDTMGGDRGLEVQVEGALQASREWGVRSILVGPKEELNAVINKLGGKNSSLSVVHAPDTITMDDSPARSVRRKPDSSLCVAFRLVQSGQASAIISAGNSGAMMVAGTFYCGLLPGIERPAIATMLPKSAGDRPNVILDSGANVECHAHNLVQFAVMGSVYYSCLFSERRPKVALLSNGTEPSKGTDVIRSAAYVLSQLEGINYIGYVEGRDVGTDKVDIVVCDGMTGNVLLKALEGCVRLIADQLQIEAKRGFLRGLGLLLSKPMLKELFYERFDYTAHGGAPLLGLQRLGVVLHGSSDARAVKNALRVSNEFVQSQMIRKIAEALGQLEDLEPSVDDSILSGVFSRKDKNGHHEPIAIPERDKSDNEDAAEKEENE